MELPQDFHVDLLFPDNYSDFIAEVYFKDRLVLVINQEKGPNQLDVEFGLDIRGFPDRCLSMGSKMQLFTREADFENFKKKNNLRFWNF